MPYDIMKEHVVEHHETPEIWELVRHLIKKDAHLFERNNEWTIYGKTSGYLKKISKIEADILSDFVSPHYFSNKIPDGFAKQFLLEIVSGIKSRKIFRQSINPPKSVQLILSDACNMKCSYCYGSYYDTNYYNKLMPREIAIRAIDFAVNTGVNNIGFFGGEPLLNFNTIKEVIKHSKSQGYNLQFGMTTNGTLITEEIARFLKDNNVLVSVSIDGPPLIHNITRKYKNGKASYRNVFRGIEILKRHDCLDMLEMTYSNKHPVDLKPILRFLSSHNPSISCTCVEGKLDAYFSEEIIKGERLRRYYNDMFDFVVETKSGGIDIIVGGMNELITEALSDTTIIREHICGTILNRVSIGVDGTIYPCPETMTKSFAIANVLDGCSLERFNDRREHVLGKLTKGNLKEYWFGNLTDICIARISIDADGKKSIEDSQAIGMALEDILYKIASSPLCQ
jgi:uncharacterized protein